MPTFRVIRDILVMLACVCVILLTAEAVYMEVRLAHVVEQIQRNLAPTPGQTGCPFGDGQCGG